jgi:DNA-binding transcriptional MerR regulator
MKIGELAQIAQTTVETVRYYEKEGLLPETTRTAGNFRVYDATHQERLRFIRNCRALDMSHEEIRTLLGRQINQPRAAAPNLVQHMAHVDERIRELNHLKSNCPCCANAASERSVDTVASWGLADMKTRQNSRHTHLG